jgi:hypothetical protein
MCTIKMVAKMKYLCFVRSRGVSGDAGRDVVTNLDRPSRGAYLFLNYWALMLLSHDNYLVYIATLDSLFFPFLSP